MVFDGTTDWKVVAMGDFNGDRRCDLVWQYPTGKVVVWLMAGVQQVGSATLYADATAWKVVSAGDMNDDGNCDLIWQSATGQVVVWFFDRATKIGAEVLLSTPTEWVVTATADMKPMVIRTDLAAPHGPRPRLVHGQPREDRVDEHLRGANRVEDRRLLIAGEGGSTPLPC